VLTLPPTEIVYESNKYFLASYQRAQLSFPLTNEKSIRTTLDSNYDLLTGESTFSCSVRYIVFLMTNIDQETQMRTEEWRDSAAWETFIVKSDELAKP
jgi:hypothetical protein